jgi:hypothetical protein
VLLVSGLRGSAREYDQVNHLSKDDNSLRFRFLFIAKTFFMRTQAYPTSNSLPTWSLPSTLGQRPRLRLPSLPVDAIHFTHHHTILPRCFSTHHLNTSPLHHLDTSQRYPLPQQHTSSACFTGGIQVTTGHVKTGLVASPLDTGGATLRRRRVRNLTIASDKLSGATESEFVL